MYWEVWVQVDGILLQCAIYLKQTDFTQYMKRFADPNLTQITETWSKGVEWTPLPRPVTVFDSCGRNAY